MTTYTVPIIRYPYSLTIQIKHVFEVNTVLMWLSFGVEGSEHG